MLCFGGQIRSLELNIFEPPRLFEALLRGRAIEEVPDITARICGICPVAYQMRSVHALEAAMGLYLAGNSSTAAAPLLRRMDRKPLLAHPSVARARLLWATTAGSSYGRKIFPTKSVRA